MMYPCYPIDDQDPEVEMARVHRLGSYRVSYGSEGETTQAFTKTYRWPIRRSRSSTNSYAMLRRKSQGRRYA